MRQGSLNEVGVAIEQEIMGGYSLQRIRDLHGDAQAQAFKQEVSDFVDQNPTDVWVKTWAANQGTALDCYAWDQDHDYGEGLQVIGAMGPQGAAGARHTRGLLNAARLRETGIDLRALSQGHRCCVVGAWCGYEVMLLDGFGAAEVDVVEEVPVFASWSKRHKEVFSIRGDNVYGCSLYDMPKASLLDPSATYDVIYCPGVLYHCSDPACALAILRLMLRPGGVLLFETMTLPDKFYPHAQYRGPSQVGWNWWIPTGNTWLQIMQEVGFKNCQQMDLLDGRGWFIGSAEDKVPSLVASGAAGFARTDILDVMHQRIPQR